MLPIDLTTASRYLPPPEDIWPNGGHPDTDDGQFNEPHGIAVNSSGFVFVTAGITTVSRYLPQSGIFGSMGVIWNQ